MLIGIVKKNAIMMIDFALEAERKENKSPRDAIVEGCLVRFRPIMMTTMAAIMGTLPIAIGFGAGAEARRPLGLAVVGGLVFSQLLTLYITPVYYIYLDTLKNRIQSFFAGLFSCAGRYRTHGMISFETLRFDHHDFGHLDNWRRSRPVYGGYPRIARP